LPHHQRDHLLEAPEAGRARGEHLDAPAVPLGVARVHAEELGSEQARLVAARAGTDLEHRVALVVGVLGEEELLEGRVEGGPARAPSHPARGPPAVTSGRRGAGAATLEAVFALETLDPAGRVDQLLLAGEERMARRADLDVDGRHGGAGLDDAAAGTDDGRFLV